MKFNLAFIIPSILATMGSQNIFSKELIKENPPCNTQNIQEIENQALGLNSSVSSAINDLHLTPTEPKLAWNKKEIKVCWGNKDHQNQSWVRGQDYNFAEYTDEQKVWIKEIINKEYNIKETGISFVGWEKCNPDVKDIDVILFRIAPPAPQGDGAYTMKGGLATLGEKGIVTPMSDSDSSTPSQLEYTKAPYPQANVVILNTFGSDQKKTDAKNYVQMLALHEFGHTAGLRHQHIRMESAKQDPNCKNNMETMKEEKVYNSTIFTGEYDYNSVMNYCYLNKLTGETGLVFKAKNAESTIKMTDESLYTIRPAVNMFGKVIENKMEYTVRVGLSALDKHALRCLYLNEEEAKIKNCNVTK